MMKITTGMTEDGKFCVTVSSRLLETYYPNFSGMISSDSNCPRDLSIERQDKNTAFLVFPVGEGAILNKSGDRVGVDINGVKTLKDVLAITKRFSITAIRHQQRTLEYIPLKGYPLKELQKDVVAAVENKRSFVMIDTYDNWKENCQNPGKEFPQFVVPFGTNEYTNVFLMIRNGEFNKLKKEYKPKLKMMSWV